jgi:L-lactate utilization protein LutC
MVGVGGEIYGTEFAEAMTYAAISNSSRYLPPELQNFMDSIVEQTFSHHERATAAEQQHNREVGEELQEYSQEYAQSSPEELAQNWENAIAQVQNDLALTSLNFDFQDLNNSEIDNQTQVVADVRERGDAPQIG